MTPALLFLVLPSCSGTDDVPDTEPTGVPIEDTTPSEDTSPGTTADTDTGTLGLPTNIVECGDPSARESLGPFDMQRYDTDPVSLRWIWGSAPLISDLDGDGALEVWGTDEAGMRSFSVEGDVLVPGIAPAHDLTGASGGAFADYDGDGDLDAYITRWGGTPAPEWPNAGYNRLLRNDGKGVFTDVTETAGGLSGCLPDGPCLRSVTASWGDIDRDGDLDLFVGSHGYLDESGIPAAQQGPGDPSFLFENLGDGTFDNVSPRMPEVMDRSYTLGGGFHDLNDDGWLDLYSANDVGQYQRNVILWNEKGRFAYYPDEASGLTVVGSSMGFTANDLNGDLVPDIVIPIWGDIFYLESVASLGLWIDSATARGITANHANHIGWGSDMFDLENDGDLDVVTQFGHLDPTGNPSWNNPAQQPDTLHVNHGTPTAPSFVEEAEAWGLADIGANRGVATADLNEDGYLDLVKLNLEGDLLVWMSRCGTAGWLEIALDQPGTQNLHGVGSRVLVEANGTVWTRTVNAGGTSIGVGLPPEVHFGFGDIDVVDRIEVRWPDGILSEWTDVPTRQQILLTRK